MTEKQLMDVMSEEQVEQMCFEKPLWKMRYFTSVEGGRSALYFRFVFDVRVCVWVLVLMVLIVLWW